MNERRHGAFGWLDGTGGCPHPRSRGWLGRHGAFGWLDGLLGDRVDGRALAVLRVLLGFCVWFEARQNVWRLDQYTPGQLHLPLLGPEGGYSFETGVALCAWQMRFGLALALGLFGRVAALGALVCQGALFTVSALNFQNHVYLMLVLLGLVAASRCDARWSVTRALSMVLGWKPGGDLDGLVPRMIQLQVMIIYFYSGLHKAALGFASGYPLCRFAGRDVPRSPMGELFGPSGSLPWPGFGEWVETRLSGPSCEAGAPWVVVAASVGTIALELLLAVGLASRRTFFLAAILGVAFHSAIYLSMSVVTFGLMMVATYPLFWAAPWWQARPTQGGAVPDASAGPTAVRESESARPTGGAGVASASPPVRPRGAGQTSKGLSKRSRRGEPRSAT